MAEPLEDKMSCSLIKSQTEKVLSDEEFLRELENRIGIRFMFFRDKFHKPSCNVFLFGYTDQTRLRFFWLETSISVVSMGRIELQIWNDNILENLGKKFLSWEKVHKDQMMRRLSSLTWWDKLVTNQLFTCIFASATEVSHDQVSTIAADDPRLQIFYGLLAAHIKNHADDLNAASSRYHGLIREYLVVDKISKRLNGFVYENYSDGFGISDEV